MTLKRFSYGDDSPSFYKNVTVLSQINPLNFISAKTFIRWCGMCVAAQMQGQSRDLGVPAEGAVIRSGRSSAPSPTTLSHPRLRHPCPRHPRPYHPRRSSDDFYETVVRPFHGLQFTTFNTESIPAVALTVVDDIVPLSRVRTHTSWGPGTSQQVREWQFVLATRFCPTHS